LNIKSTTSLHILLLLSACFFLFFFRMGARDLWNPDEPRYAQVAREMLETGEYVVPHLNGQVYTEKPPLYFWLIALISKPFGDVNEVTARLPSALAATLIVLLTYFLGMKMFGRREAFIGAAVMATSAQFFSIGRVGALDMVVALSVLAALAVFYVAYVDKRPVLYSGGFALLVPGVMTKGPVALAVPLVVMLAFLILEIILRKEGAAKQLCWFAVSTVAGLAIVALIVVPWWLEAHERSGGVYGSLSILVKQTGGRMLKSYSHQRPFHYYFGEILWQYLPWTVFFPLTAYAIRKKGDLRENLALRFLLVWFLGVFIFFTCISGKRGQYLLPLFPASGLILGWALTVSNPFEGRLKRRIAFSIPLLALALISIGGLVALVVGAYLKAPEHLSTALIAVFAAGVCLAILVRQCLSRPPVVALACVAVVTVLVVSILFGYIGPVADKYKSARPFCEEIIAAAEEDDAVHFFGFYRPNIHYYLHRTIPYLESGEQVLAALDRSPRVFLILQQKERRTLEEIASVYGLEIKEFTRVRIGSRDIICVIAHPLAASG